MMMAPWWRGPGLLLRRPGVALALTAAAFVATLPAASAPLFLSSARSATLRHGIATDCPTYVGPLITGDLPFHTSQQLPQSPQLAAVYGTANFRARAEQADRAAARIPHLGPAITSMWAGTNSATTKGDTVNITLASRDGFQDHVRSTTGTPVTPAGSSGAWIPDSLTELTGQKVGDPLTVTALVPTGRPGETVPVSRQIPIVAIYRDLRRSPDAPYWCLMKYVYRGPPGSEFSNRFIPPMVLVDAPTLLATGESLGYTANHAIEYHVTDPKLTQPEAVRMSRDIATMRQQLVTASPPVFRSDFRMNSVVKADIGKFADRAELVRTSLLPPVLPITGAGVLVGLLVVGAAAIFWVQRRRTELRVLAIRGTSPGALGVKAVAEALPALIVGVTAGWLMARVLVGWAGPNPLLSAEAVPLSVLAAALSLPVAALVLGWMAALGSRNLADQAPPRHRRARILGWPWELLLVAAAVPVWFLLGDVRELTGTPGATGSVAQVPGRLLVVPIMAIGGAAVFCARGGIRWLRERGGYRSPRRPTTFLAWRRITREAVVAATLAAAIAIPVGFAAYGATVTGSVRATLAAEARVRDGSDVVLTLSRPAPVPASLAGRATEVLRIDAATVNGLQTDVLAVDPATFARDAFWDDRIDGRPLAQIVAGIRAPTGSSPTAGSFPAAGSGDLTDGAYQVTWGTSKLGTADVRHVAMLPAEQGGYPVLLVDRSAVADRYLAQAKPQLWVRGDPTDILRAAEAARLPLARTTVAADMYANTLFEPLTYTFDYLVALSVLTGVIAVVGLLLYLEGRAPRQRRAYVMLRRMGLRRGAHRRVVLLEVLAPLVTGLVVGVALAAAIVKTLAKSMEVNPDTPPDTVLSPPVGVLTGVGAAVIVIGVLAAWYAHYRVRTAKPSEVLRDIA